MSRIVTTIWQASRNQNKEAFPEAKYLGTEIFPRRNIWAPLENNFENYLYDKLNADVKSAIKSMQTDRLQVSR